MSKNPNLLNQCLKEAGIPPRSFAYFLIEYIKSKAPQKTSVLSKLLTKQMQADAQLIVHHINRPAQ